MIEDTQQLQKRLNDVQAKIKYLTLEKDRNDKERTSIEVELKKLNIESAEQLESIIKKKEDEIALYTSKLELALKKLEDKTNDLENKVKGN